MSLMCILGTRRRSRSGGSCTITTIINDENIKDGKVKVEGVFTGEGAEEAGGAREGVLLEEAEGACGALHRCGAVDVRVCGTRSNELRAVVRKAPRVREELPQTRLCDTVPRGPLVRLRERLPREPRECLVDAITVQS